MIVQDVTTMMNLAEIMQAAQGGNAMTNMASQFGLSPEQTQSAMEALLPAFQNGLQRQTQDASSMTDFLQNLAGGNHAAFHDADGDGIPDDAATAGQDVLGQLFGSKDVSRAVAAQAAATTGISDTILKSMLPVVASMVMGGLFKGMANQGFGGLLGQIAGGALQGGNNPLGSILGQMMGGQQGSAMNVNAGGMGGGIGDILGKMMGGGQQAGAAQSGGGIGDILGKMLGGAQQGGAGQAAGGGLGGMLGQMMGGMMGGQQQQAAPATDPMQAGLEALTSMFNAGTQGQGQGQNAMGSIFEAMLGGAKR
jgi:hypothetical protein